MSTPHVVNLVMHRASRVLEVGFSTGESFQLSAEYLRTHSPSAEVQGHGPSQRVLVAGKADVNIDALEPIGNYAVLLRFSDGHQTGIFSWEVLWQLGQQQAANWTNYLAALEAANVSRQSSPPSVD